MIQLKDIIKSVTQVIEANEGNVIAGEIEESFERPAYFVNCFPVNITKDNQFEENVNATVTIDYVPKIQTVEECVRIADILSGVFNGKLEVGDRKLDIGNVAISLEVYVLEFSFELDFWRETSIYLPEYENMENLNLREDVK